MEGFEVGPDAEPPDQPCLRARGEDGLNPMTFDLAKYVRTRDPIDGSTAGGGDSGGPPVVDGEPNCASFTDLGAFHPDLENPRS